tara:strand:- start:482 stop:946 length:465 start_codon:yes stop_codon:yes gene_type:complete
MGVNIAHGMTGTPIYYVWKSMTQRCTNINNKAYPYYGGRGISVCVSWVESFSVFYEDMGLPPSGATLERVKVNLGYSKENCIWATRTEQARNRRKFKNNTSGRTGVHLCKIYNKWRTSITVDKKTINLGTFDIYSDAVAARETAELKYFGYIKD